MFGVNRQQGQLRFYRRGHGTNGHARQVADRAEPGLFLNAVREILDDGVGEDLFGDALDLGAGGVG